MNLLEIRTELRRALKETSATKSTFSDTDANKAINEGIKDMCIKGNVYEKTVTQAVATTVATYSLSWDFLKPISILNPSGVSLDRMEPAELGKRFIITGKPLYFYLSQIAFTPTVRANSTSYGLGVILIPATPNGFLYEVTVAGITGGGLPTYPTNSGSSVADGAATLTCRELITHLNSITFVDTPTTAGGGTGVYTLIYSALDEGLYVDTDSPNFPWDKHHFLVDFAAWRLMMDNRQTRDSMPFIMSYAAGMGVDISGYLGGKQAE